jgi:hypothetical protein
LSGTDLADYEAIMAQREEITAAWLSSSAPVTRIVEERLWLHRDLFRPALSGQIDELLIQGARALLFDVKSGQGQRWMSLQQMCSFAFARCLQRFAGRNWRASQLRCSRRITNTRLIRF